MSSYQQADVLTYHQIIEHDELEKQISLMGGRSKPGSVPRPKKPKRR